MKITMTLTLTNTEIINKWNPYNHRRLSEYDDGICKQTQITAIVLTRVEMLKCIDKKTVCKLHNQLITGNINEIDLILIE